MGWCHFEGLSLAIRILLFLVLSNFTDVIFFNKPLNWLSRFCFQFYFRLSRLRFCVPRQRVSFPTLSCKIAILTFCATILYLFGQLVPRDGVSTPSAELVKFGVAFTVIRAMAQQETRVCYFLYFYHFWFTSSQRELSSKSCVQVNIILIYLGRVYLFDLYKWTNFF